MKTLGEWALCAALVAGANASAAVPQATPAPAPATGGATADAATAARMQWFENAKFGIFIHWGIYSVDGIAESWSFYDGHVSYAHYMAQEKGFTASRYDPQAWADLIRASGAKYAVMTTKHHDGVALWDTRHGLNVVKDTPAKRDLVAPFVAALREDGLKVGLYFSLIDWSDPDYPGFTKDESRYQIKDDPARWQRFVTYYQDQVHDLTRRYHPDLYWFDGDWEHTAAEWHARQLREWILQHNPTAIINGRLAGYGDYATPEQGVPIARPPDKYWELCLTMNDSWGWQPNDHHFKTPYEIIRILSDTLDMGGNLLLDIGPRADGTIPRIEVDTLKQVGRWVRKNQEAVYGSRAGIPHDYYLGDSTLSPDRKTLYLFIDGRPNGPVMLKGLVNHVEGARVVGNGTVLTAHRLGATLGGAPAILTVQVPHYALDPDVTVIALELDGPIKLFRAQGKPIDAY
ncbi:MAG TPA: alpha-L-fucosidase [Rhodanobacteraceae bacterium]|nr:alpha-L-fucosidase [Rhodanobacteraceae bacterium]